MTVILVSRLCSALAVDIKSWFERKSNISIADGAERSDFQRLGKATDEADPPEVKNLPLSLIKSVELSHSSVPRQWIHLVHGKGSNGYRGTLSSLLALSLSLSVCLCLLLLISFTRKSSTRSLFLAPKEIGKVNISPSVAMRTLCF
jgi:hypothetical protein